MLKKGEMIEERDGGVGRTVRTYTGDYTVDEKSKSATLTEEGVLKLEKLLGVDNLYEPRNMAILHHVNQALKAHALFKRDVDYVVKDGEVIIVDEFTGRLMPGRRWSDGQHQAIEAKEGLEGRAGEPDPGHDHLPELLPHVRETVRHDRYRRYRGRRVQRDLQARRGGHPDQPADDPHRSGGCDLQDREGKISMR